MRRGKESPQSEFRGGSIMSDRGVKVKLGGFVLVTLGILAGLVVAFGGAPSLFTAKSRYTLTFSEAPGVAVGTPIRKSGVRIGEVAAIDLDPETGQVFVRADVDRKYQPRRHEDAIIARGLLSGDTTIDFLPRVDDDGKPLPIAGTYEPGSDIAGLPPITARSLMSQAQGILPSTQQSLDRMVATFEKLERLAPKIERAVEEFTNLAKDGREFLPELRKTNRQIQEFIGSPEPDLGAAFVAVAPVIPGSAIPPQMMPPGAKRDATNLRALVGDARQFLRMLQPAVEDVRDAIRRNEPEVTATIKSARVTLDSAKQMFDGVNEVLSPENRKQFSELTKNLVSLSGNLVRLTVAIGGLLDEGEKTVRSLNARVTQSEGILNDLRAFTKPLGERSDRMVANLDFTLDQLAKSMQELRALTGGLGQGGGSLTKFFSDPMLYHNLNDAALSLARVMGRAERIAKDLEIFSDKIARKPESIGVGGALRPNSGLKDVPGAPLPSYRPDWPPAVPSYRYPTLQPPVARSPGDPGS